MSDSNQRLTAWQIKTDTGRMKETLDALRPEMLEHYKAAVASLCEMETKARQTLNAAGVHTVMYVPYLSYARQLYKLSRQQGISGESFALVAKVLLDKRAACGLDPAVLAAIRADAVEPRLSARRPIRPQTASKPGQHEGRPAQAGRQASTGIDGAPHSH